MVQKNKLELYGLKKSENHSIFHIEKHKIFLERFREFLHNLGFSEGDTANELLSLMGDVDNNYSAKKYSNKLYQDEYFYFKNKEYKIEIFFGKEKIIISIFTKSNKQQEIMKEIDKFCTFKN
jgi:hypothetical protein